MDRLHAAIGTTSGHEVVLAAGELQTLRSCPVTRRSAKNSTKIPTGLRQSSLENAEVHLHPVGFEWEKQFPKRFCSLSTFPMESKKQTQTNMLTLWTVGILALWAGGAMGRSGLTEFMPCKWKCCANGLWLQNILGTRVVQWMVVLSKATSCRQSNCHPPSMFLLIPHHPPILPGPKKWCKGAPPTARMWTVRTLF